MRSMRFSAGDVLSGRTARDRTARRRAVLALFCLLLPALLPAGAPSARAQDAGWKVGAAFREQMALPTGLVWADNPLRPALWRLSEVHGIGIFLDRRIDPGQLVSLRAQDVALAELLAQIAAEVGAGISILDSVVYLGPTDVTRRLATVAALRREALDALPADARRRWVHRAACQWEILATPTEVLEQLAGEGGFRITNLAQVPHDLWPAVSLPPMRLVDRLSLVLAGFSVTFDLSEDGRAVTLRAMSDQPRLVRAYRHRGRVPQVMSQLSEQFPGIEIRRDGTRWQVAATYEEHDEVRRALADPAASQPAATGGTARDPEKRYTLNIKNELAGAVLKTIVEAMDLQPRITPRAAPKLRERVTVRVEEVAAESLLEAVLKPLGLQFRVEGSQLSIDVAP